eukprot:767315-Ditylum_brightwellii.AAC.1
MKTAEDNGTKCKWSNNQQHQTTQFFTALLPQTTRFQPPSTIHTSTSTLDTVSVSTEPSGGDM